MTAPESIYGHEHPDTSSCDVPRWEEDAQEPRTLDEFRAAKLPTLYLVFQENGDMLDTGGIVENIDPGTEQSPIADLAAWFMQNAGAMLGQAFQDVRAARAALAEPQVITGDRERTIISVEG